MERFLGALSITLLLSGWAAITQFQSPYQSPQNSVVQFAQAESSQSHPAPAEVIPDRSQLIDILARALKVSPSQAVYSPLDRFHHAQASRQVSVVSSQNMSPFSKIYGDVQAAMSGTFTP